MITQAFPNNSPDYIRLSDSLVDKELERRNKQLSGIQKEINHYGSQSPIMTNARAGMGVAVLSLIGYAYVSTQISDSDTRKFLQDACNKWIAIGAGSSFLAGCFAEQAHIKTIQQYDKVEEERTKFIESLVKQNT